MTKSPSIGRIVNYVPTDKESEQWNGVKILPAMIVRVHAPDMVNLKVFTDAPNNAWITSVELSANQAKRSWHWPEIK